MSKRFLDSVYGTQARDDITGFYAEWAETYEAELAENRYETPGRVARMLVAAGVPKTARVLDYGCGTGLSGAALLAEGYDALTGTDPTPEMLARAEARGIYQRLWQTDLDAALPVAPGDYDVIAAIGVVSPGAAPPSLLATLMDLLAPGAHCVWSFNQHGLDDPDYVAARDAVLARDDLSLVAEEYGPHLSARNVNSSIYLVQAVEG